MATKRRLKKGSRRRRTQKLYKMKGCSKKCKGGKGWKGGCKGGKKTRGGVGGPRKHLFVTYTGGNTDVDPVVTQKPANDIFGSQTGGCGCSTSLFGGASGGQSGGSCAGDQCSIQGSVQGGGADALVGPAWNPANPGALPVPNHLALNTYSPVDISRQMLATGAQPPFGGGGARGGGKRRRRMYKKGGAHKGGGMIDYPAYYGSALTSAFAGTSMPVSPSPTEGQFASTHSRV